MRSNNIERKCVKMETDEGLLTSGKMVAFLFIRLVVFGFGIFQFSIWVCVCFFAPPKGLNAELLSLLSLL